MRSAHLQRIAAVAREPERQEGEAGDPRRLERMVDAMPSGQRQDLLDETVLVGGDEQVRRSETARPGKRVRVAVDGDDESGAGQPRALDDVEANSAAADAPRPYRRA